jgi:predicted nucleic acid-binding protein
MVISVDTSFLFSLYGNDSKTADAVNWSAQNSHALLISSLNHFELINALRFAECRGFIGLGQSRIFAADFETDIRGGRLVESPLHLTEVLAEASRLSTAHTLTGGHRGFDILHVAAAKIIGATHFLTFDANQKALAAKEGFITPL